MDWEWKLTSEEKPSIDSNVQTSEDGIRVGETMDYREGRTCMLAGDSGGNGYFGEGFATDGSTGCERGLILDEPKYWRYSHETIDEKRRMEADEFLSEQKNMARMVGDAMIAGEDATAEEILRVKTTRMDDYMYSRQK